jgi:hypothetical protein
LVAPALVARGNNGKGDIDSLFCATPDYPGADLLLIFIRL